MPILVKTAEQRLSDLERRVAKLEQAASRNPSN